MQASLTTEELWKRHKIQERNGPRFVEHSSNQLHYKNAVLRYVKARLGEVPSSGYPLYICLHGGGGGPAHINDMQWYHMQRYYKASVNNGVYIAPRGIDDTWDLHFRSETYVLLEGLIENMILFEDVDPNRVYLLGYSAGGDGVYQLAPRLAHRFAAVNMSAGHSNGVSLLNLMNTPICIQMGEHDEAYGRNEDAVRAGAQLSSLALHSTGYIHDVFLHAGKAHNFRDEEQARVLQAVVQSPLQWLSSTRRDVCPKIILNTNAVDWVSQHSRNPYPDSLIWDVATRAARTSATCRWYWLDIEKGMEAYAEGGRISATSDRSRNAVTIDGAKRFLRILLNERMLNLREPLGVSVQGQTLNIRAKKSETLWSQTLKSRQDPFFAFTTAIDLVDHGGTWAVTLVP
jgi:predicted esterase